MRKSWSGGFAVCIILATMSAAPAHADEQAVSPLVKQINSGNWLPQAEARSRLWTTFSTSRPFKPTLPCCRP